MTGAGTMTVKTEVLDTVPPAAVTLIEPLVAPDGTVKESCAELTTVYEHTIPFSRTAVTPVKPVPETVTAVPGVPLEGAKLEIVGGGTVTVNAEVLFATPAALTMVINPEVAPEGTVNVICEAFTTVKAQFVPFS
jgi:hypothetical protein